MPEERCAKCRHPRFIHNTEIETHQVATIGETRVNICYGGCLHGKDAPNYHTFEEEAK